MAYAVSQEFGSRFVSACATREVSRKGVNDTVKQRIPRRSMERILVPGSSGVKPRGCHFSGDVGESPTPGRAQLEDRQALDRRVVRAPLGREALQVRGRIGESESGPVKGGDHNGSIK